MKKISSLLTKLVLAGMILALGITVLPLSGVSAAGLNEPANPPVSQSKPDYPRLERIWNREQIRYQREGKLLDNANTLIAKVQTLLDKAAKKGWDVTAVQAALNAFSNVIPAAQAAHQPGEAIIRTHAGFNANGEVTDRVKAVETVKALAQVLKDTRTALNGTGRALRQAIRAFRQAHQPSVTPTP